MRGRVGAAAAQSTQQPASQASPPLPRSHQFDGNNCYLQLQQEQVAGVLMVAADNARDAREAAAAVRQQAAQQAAVVAEEAARLLAAVAQPAEEAEGAEA